MPLLSLRLFGAFQATLDQQPITGFKSNKVRALLAYLAVEMDRPHRRDELAALLWPDWSDQEALSNLRFALSNMRQAIGDHQAEPPFLLITRDSLQFNSLANFWLDVHAFTDLAQQEKAHPLSLERLKQAAALYTGGFLAGFSLDDSPAFDDWTFFTRERLARQALSTLYRLSHLLEQAGDYQEAQRWARRQIELEPCEEAAHRQLMRSLAFAGQRNAALAQYETCRRLLREELDVEPAEETRHLFEEIRSGRLKSATPVSPSSADIKRELPDFLTGPSFAPGPTLFVSREGELGRLDGFLRSALVGQGRVIFVAGEMGSGKTALLQKFVQRSQSAFPDLVVAAGNTNAYTGVGDPYLPFREILEALTGDIHAPLAAGAITLEYARRLWRSLPLTVNALVHVGADLVDTFLPRARLLERALSYAGQSGGGEWLGSLQELVAQKPLAYANGAMNLQQSALYDQYTRVLQALAQQAPLLLVIDDLQWADLGSIGLLFHLGRRLPGCRILVAGAFRPEELAISREPATELARPARHPLVPVINEFQRLFGEITVDLSLSEGRDFIDAFIDSEPNRLGADFREMLWRQTRGHPLFTIELLRGMQERGDLRLDGDQCWTIGPQLDWGRLPARVEAVIAERINRLEPPLQADLRAASVEGEIFTAEVIARLRGSNEHAMVERLSSELDRQHRLVRAHSIQRIGDQLHSRYRFRHILFQKYLYNSLDEVERVRLHEQVGTTLEQLFTAHDQLAENAVQLARHFQEARITSKAIHYLTLAADKALQMSAFSDAITHVNAGLALLPALAASQPCDEQELALQLALALAYQGLIGTPTNEVKNAFNRAEAICRRLGKTSQLCQVLGGLALHAYVRAEHEKACLLASETLDLANQTGDEIQQALSHWYLGCTQFCRGNYVQSWEHLQQVNNYYDPAKHHRHFVQQRGSDAGMGAIAYTALCLWCLGYPEQAWRYSQQALAIAQELNHPFTQADVLCFAGCRFNAMRLDGAALAKYADQQVALAEERGLSGWLADGIAHRGKALILSGQPEDGAVVLRAGMQHMQGAGERLYLSECFYFLAQAQWLTGQVETSLATLEEALAFVEETGERLWQVELIRLKGELLQVLGDEASAQAHFKEAIQVAQHQQAKMWELRATVSLCRLWRSQGKIEAARQALAAMYNWFSEGWDERDLQEARQLLEDLSRAG